MKTHCKAGHEFTEQNTYYYESKRICRTCRKETMQKRRTPKGYANSRKTECPKGHPYDDSNTTLWRGKRICKICAKFNADWQRLKKYGLDRQSYQELLIKQKGKCVLCLREFSSTPHIDHDHETGKVRGLLCYPCNSGLGQFEDDIDRLKRAIKYLKQS